MTFREPVYFRQLLRAGRELGVTVFLFSPRDVQVKRRRIRGITLTDRGRWASRWFSWPDVVIDRYWYTPKPVFQEYVSFRKQPYFLYANNRFANKWRVHEVLYSNENMRKWLPETCTYTGEKGRLKEMLTRHRIIYLKPINGTGGRGILRIEKRGEHYHLLGRDKQRVKKAAVAKGSAGLISRVRQWVGQEKYLMQQGLELGLLPGRSVDIRLLMQKDEHAEWLVTGMGCRVGPKNSATANLHGGGKAVAADHFLTQCFSEEKAKQLIEECEQLAYETAAAIEAYFGSMMELGLDIGIDVQGRVWLIEINPKPGRDIFREMGQPDLYRLAVRRPLQYALTLASRKHSSLQPDEGRCAETKKSKTS